MNAIQKHKRKKQVEFIKDLLGFLFMAFVWMLLLICVNL
jgi:hypothetical protein